MANNFGLIYTVLHLAPLINKSNLYDNTAPEAPECFHFYKFIT